MKIRITDRILVALAGLLIIAGSVALAAQLFFGKDVVGYAAGILAPGSTRKRVILIAAAVLLLALGIYCVLVLFRHRSRKDKFVTQKTENGELSISVKALTNMVEKCLMQHKEINVQNVSLESVRDGILIRVRGIVAGGISIPLTVEELQRQIKQYVTACSGVEVKGIRVLIESSGEDAKDAPFAIAAPAAKGLLREADKTEEPSKQDAVPEVAPFVTMAETTLPAETPAEIPVPETVVPPEDYVDEDDDRPVHQRLFSPKEEPCIIPMPPQPEEAEPAGITEEQNEDAAPPEVTEEADESTIQAFEEADETTEPVPEEKEPSADETTENNKERE